jgi:hypothetical protein
VSVPRRRTHYVNPKLTRRIRPEKGGYGVFAQQTVQAGELLVVWGGDIVTGADLDDLSPVARRHSIQVEENLFLVPHELPEVGDFINHSCSPNAGLSGQLALVALRQVSKGEEICYDYAMSDGSDYDEFTCSCGTPACRLKVTGHDWALEELQTRYAGCFSPYLQRRIDAARATPTLTAVPDLLVELPG